MQENISEHTKAETSSNSALKVKYLGPERK